mmetsp:Transcript_9607/g.34113  ORF Transcript_9607/g.34113 Transcript_9607/m.34113 type:complete len:244 (+) Transcript_9607:95-826(+)
MLECWCAEHCQAWENVDVQDICSWQQEEAQAVPASEEELRKVPRTEGSAPVPTPRSILVDPASGRVFEAVIAKEGPLGLLLDVKAHLEAGALSVIRVNGGGCIEAYNSKADPDVRLELHDYIVAINGQTSCAAMLLQAKGCKGALKIKVVRPKPWVVKIVKGDKPFGAGLIYQNDSTSVGIKEVREGALKDYNARARPELQLLIGDSILKVNSIAGAAQQMVETMRTLTEFELTCTRAPKLTP